MKKKPLILIVDDEEDFIEIMDVKLRAEGFDTAAVYGGEEVLKQAETLSPELILMDIYMPPQGYGTDIGIALRQNEKTKNIKIAFFSAINDPFSMIGGEKEKIIREMNLMNFLRKDDDLDLTVERIRQILSRDISMIAAS